MYKVNDIFCQTGVCKVSDNYAKILKIKKYTGNFFDTGGWCIVSIHNIGDDYHGITKLFIASSGNKANLYYQNESNVEVDYLFSDLNDGYYTLYVKSIYENYRITLTVDYASNITFLLPVHYDYFDTLKSSITPCNCAEQTFNNLDMSYTTADSTNQYVKIAEFIRLKPGSITNAIFKVNAISDTPAYCEFLININKKGDESIQVELEVLNSSKGFNIDNCNIIAAQTSNRIVSVFINLKALKTKFTFKSDMFKCSVDGNGSFCKLYNNAVSIEAIPEVVSNNTVQLFN